MNNTSKARKNLIDMYVKSLEEGQIPWEKMWPRDRCSAA